MLAKKAQLKKSLTRIEDMENRGIESRQRSIQIDNMTLKALFGKLYSEYVEARVSKDKLLHDQGLDLGRTGPAQFEYDPSLLEPQKPLKCTMASLGTLTAEIPEDVIRAKHCYVNVPQPRVN